jgi:hypothetical protein
MPSQKVTLRKTTFEEEQSEKDEAFLKLKPTERLQIHEELRKKYGGNSISTNP